MDESKLSILEKTGSTDVKELVAEVRRLEATTRRLAEIAAERLREFTDFRRKHGFHVPPAIVTHNSHG